MINMYEVSETNEMIEHENLERLRSASVFSTALIRIWKSSTVRYTIRLPRRQKILYL